MARWMQGLQNGCGVVGLWGCGGVVGHFTLLYASSSKVIKCFSTWWLHRRNRSSSRNRIRSRSRNRREEKVLPGSQFVFLHTLIIGLKNVKQTWKAKCLGAGLIVSDSFPGRQVAWKVGRGYSCHSRAAYTFNKTSSTQQGQQQNH